MLELGFWWFLGIFINVVTGIFVLSKISNKKIDWKNWKFYFFSLLLFVAISINCYFIKEMRLLISTLLMIIYCYAVFERKINKAIISSLFEQLIMIISEILMLLITFIIFGSQSNWHFSEIVGQLYINVTISVIAILIVYIPLIKKAYNGINNLINKIDNRMKYLYISLFIMTLNIFLSLIYYSQSLETTLIINLLFIIIYSIVMYVALKEKNENLEFKLQNKALMDNLHVYEKMLDHHKVANHENKNQLLVVKSMIQKNENSVVEYINEIINDKRQDNETLYMKVNKIPTGGLQGIIYQKMLLMDELDITFSLNVNRNIKNIDFSKLKNKSNYDLCRIIGVFLDNSIEAVQNLVKKEISLNIYSDNSILVIEISNYFDKAPSVEKMDQKGYSTKGKGHGYGLSLVKEIIEQSNNLENERLLIKDVFTQIVRIKI